MELFRLMHFFPGRNRNKQNYLPSAREGRIRLRDREQRAARAARVAKVRPVYLPGLDPLSLALGIGEVRPNPGYWGKPKPKRPDVEYGQPFPLLGLKYLPGLKYHNGLLGMRNNYDPMRELNALFARLR